MGRWDGLCYAMYVCHVTMFALPTGILDNTLDAGLLCDYRLQCHNNITVDDGNPALS